MGFTNLDSEDTASLSHHFIESVSIVEISAIVDNSPAIRIKLKGVCMREFLLLILLPSSGLVSGVKNLGVVHLLGSDLSKLRIDLDLPVVKELSLGEGLNEVANSHESLLGLSDHLLSEISHLVGVLGEVLREASLMASGWDEVHGLISLSKFKDRLLQLVGL